MVIPIIQTEVEEFLRSWVNQQPGAITFEEAAEFLDMPRDSGGTYYGRATIETALENLGCEREVLIHFWPPAAKLSQPADKAELQDTINIIREWVLSQTDAFRISEIYSNPHLRELLPCDSEMLKLIHRSLIALRCTPIARCGCEIKDGGVAHRYNPPPASIRHVSRDEIFT